MKKTTIRLPTIFYIVLFTTIVVLFVAHIMHIANESKQTVLVKNDTKVPKVLVTQERASGLWRGAIYLNYKTAVSMSAKLIKLP